MPQLLVLADDLTGAADCAVAFAAHGLHTIVVLGDSTAEANAEVVSVDADTRRLSANQAATETVRLLRKHLCNNETILYKKLDSTMRGNIGEELAAVLDVRRSLAPALAPAVAILAPAFPAAGRTTVNGQQLINGRPLGESGQSHDSRLEGQSDICAILRASHLRPAQLALHQIRGSTDALRLNLQTLAQHADVLVCDAEADDDLRRIAEAATVLGRATVWAGSGGLARHLALATGLIRTPRAAHRESLAQGPTLFVVGSGSAVSHEQVAVLAAGSDITVISIPPDLLISQETSSRACAYKLELERALSSCKDVAVLPDSGLQLEGEKQPSLVAGLAALVGPFANTVGALVATGGETARAVFEAWGVSSLRLVGEVESGLPFSVTSGWSRELPVITKAGGFGNRESLLRCRQFLRKLQRGDAATQNQDRGPA